MGRINRRQVEGLEVLRRSEKSEVELITMLRRIVGELEGAWASERSTRRRRLGGERQAGVG